MAGEEQQSKNDSDRASATLLFAGGHGWHYDRNQPEAVRLAEVLGYTEGIAPPDPEASNTKGESQCTVTFSDGHTESVTALEAHRIAASPEVVSIVSEWQQKRAEKLLSLMDQQHDRSGHVIDVIANSASALTVVLALREAAERKSKGGTSSPFGTVVLAYPAGLIKKASRFEDQKRVAKRAKEAAINRLHTEDADNAKRKFGRESVRATVRKLRLLKQKTTANIRQMNATGGVIEQATAAVSLHTDILRQLGEMDVSVNLVLGDKDVMFPAELVLASLKGGVNTVFITDTNHGWGKPGRSDAVEQHYAELTRATTVSPSGQVRVVTAEGVSEERKADLEAMIGRRAL